MRPQELIGVTEDVRKQATTCEVNWGQAESRGGPSQASRIAEEGGFRVLIVDFHKDPWASKRCQAQSMLPECSVQGRVGDKDLDANALAENVSLEGAVNEISI